MTIEEAEKLKDLYKRGYHINIKAGNITYENLTIHLSEEGIYFEGCFNISKYDKIPIESVTVTKPKQLIRDWKEL